MAAAEADAPLLTLHLRGEPEEFGARQLAQGAGRWATRLREAGVRDGEAVPLLLPTGREFIEAFFGVLCAGAVPAPLSSPMTFGGVDRYVGNLARVVEDSGARCLVVTQRMARAVEAHPTLSTRVDTLLLPSAATESNPSPPRTPSGRATALLQYTSGTTGDPKGARISHAALVANAFAIQRGLQLTPEDVGVNWLPMFHDMGLIGVLLTCVCHPYRLHLLRPESFVMHPGRWLTLMSDVGATLTAGPNFAYALCLSRGKTGPDLDLSRLRRALNGSEPVHPHTVRAFEARYAEAGLQPNTTLPVYGLAEATLAVTFPAVGAPLQTLLLDREALERDELVRPWDGGEKIEVVSVGTPVTGVEVRVRRRDGRVAREDEVGEIEVAGPSLMDGYHRRPEATAEILQDGWLRTGDLGFVHGGALFVVGRRKEVVIKGGRNVYPYDVERVASERTGHASAAFGCPNEATGTEDLVLLCEVRTDQWTRHELETQVRGDVLATLGVKIDALYLCPIGALPRTTSGKIRRRACVELVRARREAEAPS